MSARSSTPKAAPPPRSASDLDLFVGQVRNAGLRVEDAGSGVEVMRFSDVGALAWYLQMVPWAIPGFDVSRYWEQLAAAAERELVYEERCWLVTRRADPIK